MTLHNSIRGLAHIGIRVHDLARSMSFYDLLGFRHAWGPFGAENVTALVHSSGLEINLIVNAYESVTPNILMDVPVKRAGFTHIALKIDDVAMVEAALAKAGIAISGRRGENSTKAVFIRDPDGNVIELAVD